MKVEVQIDTRHMDRLLDELARRASRANHVAAEVARRTRVTGIPVDTGKLASSPRINETGDGAEIVTDVPYARFVFYGTRYVDARPPSLDGPSLADAVAKELLA